MSSSSSRTEWGVAPEYDRKERQAKLFLFKRTIQVGSSTIGSGSISPSKSSGDGPIGPLSHWALVFEFEDGSWRTAEANDNGRGTLVPRYTKRYPPEEGTCEELGTVHISPGELRTLVVRNAKNGAAYDKVRSNCQHWIFKLCENFGNEIEGKLKGHFTCGEAVGYGAAFLAGVAALGAFAAGKS